VVYPANSASRKLAAEVFPSAKWSLALSGNASGQDVEEREKSRTEASSMRARRKPLAFAAQRVSYGI
jgi:hypothetical protein